jgi:methylated-DNA-[protein]-cysteine S-methyltransferase
MSILPASQARAEFSDVLNRVAFGGERIVLERHGRHMAALVPMQDYATLESAPAPARRRDARKRERIGRPVFYAIPDLPLLGPVLLAATDEGLFRLSFGRGRAALEDRLHDAVPDALPGDTPLLRRSEKELREYVGGKRRQFDVPIDPSAYATPFLRRVLLDATRAIPFGKLKSYGEVAEAVGSPAAARAVGGAMAANPIPIVVPCHRVIAAGGRIGGYSGGSEGTGLRWKRELLKLEGSLAGVA